LFTQFDTQAKDNQSRSYPQLFWSVPSAALSSLNGNENLALVTDGDFGAQAQTAGK
jgi:hypothetical protein